jgi:hypothetical protein
MTFKTIIAAVKPWALRRAIVLAVVLLASFPVHFFVPDQANGILMGVSLALFSGVILLCIVAQRFWPIALAIIGMVLHFATLPA